MLVLKSVKRTLKGGNVSSYYFFGAVVLFLILVFIIFWNVWNKKFIRKRWPVGLSLKTKIEIWYLYSVAGIEFYRIRKSSDLLCNYVQIFLAGFKVPPECGEDNPVVLVVDLTMGTNSEKIMSKRFFMNNYSKYLSFESFKEYENYMYNLS